MPAIDKRAVVDAAIAQLTEEASTIRAQAEAARQGAVHEESRPENDKDTRGLEASYLARGQAARFEETEEAIRRLRFLDFGVFSDETPIALSALVTLDCEGLLMTYFLSPVAGGLKVDVEQRSIQLLTPSSPLGRALIDRATGDVFELRLAGRVREYEIVSVA